MSKQPIIIPKSATGVDPLTGLAMQGFQKLGLDPVGVNPTLAQSQFMAPDVAIQPGSTIDSSDYNRLVPDLTLTGNDALDLSVLNETRAQNQGAIEQLGLGLAKFVGKTGTAIAGATVGTIAGVGNMIADGSFNSFFDNDLARWLDKQNEWMDTNWQNYATKEQQEGTWWKQALGIETGFTNFWANDVMGAMSFTAGAILTEMGLTALTAATLGGGAGIQGASTLSLLAKAKKVFSGFTAEGALGAANLTKAAAKKSLWNGGTLTRKFMTGSMYEAGVEARHFKDEAQAEWLQKNNVEGGLEGLTPQQAAQMNEDVNGLANSVFALNTLLVGTSNLIQFKQIFGTGVKTNNRLYGNLSKVTGMGDDLVQTTTKDGIKRFAKRELTKAEKRWGLAYTAVKSPITEGLWEEGGQSVINKAHLEFLKNRYDIEGIGAVENMALGFGKAIEETYGTSEGWKELTIGMIVGGMSGSVANVKELGEQNKAIQGKIDMANKHTIDVIANQVKTAINQSSSAAKMDDAYTTGNILEAKNAEEDALFAFIQSRKELGMLGDTRQEFKTLISSMTDEQFLKDFGSNDMTPEEAGARKDKVLASFDTKVKDATESLNKAEELMVINNWNDTAGKDIQLGLAYLLNRTKNAERRMQEMGKEMSEILGPTFETEAALEAVKRLQEKIGTNKEAQGTLKRKLSAYKGVKTKLNKAIVDSTNLSYGKDLAKLSIAQQKVDTLQKELDAITKEIADMEAKTKASTLDIDLESYRGDGKRLQKDIDLWEKFSEKTHTEKDTKDFTRLITDYLTLHQDLLSSTDAYNSLFTTEGREKVDKKVKEQLKEIDAYRQFRTNPTKRNVKMLELQVLGQTLKSREESIDLTDEKAVKKAEEQAKIDNEIAKIEELTEGNGVFIDLHNTLLRKAKNILERETELLKNENKAALMAAVGEIDDALNTYSQSKKLDGFDAVEETTAKNMEMFIKFLRDSKIRFTEKVDKIGAIAENAKGNVFYELDDLFKIASTGQDNKIMLDQLHKVLLKPGKISDNFKEAFKIKRVKAPAGNIEKFDKRGNKNVGIVKGDLFRDTQVVIEIDGVRVGGITHPGQYTVDGEQIDIERLSTDEAYAKYIVSQLNKNWPNRLDLTVQEITRLAAFYDKIDATTKDELNVTDLEAMGMDRRTENMISFSYEKLIKKGEKLEDKLKDLPRLLDRTSRAASGTVIKYKYTLNEEEKEAQQMVVVLRKNKSEPNVRLWEYFVADVDANGEPTSEWTKLEDTSEKLSQREAIINLLEKSNKNITGVNTQFIVLGQLGNRVKAFSAEQPALEQAATTQMVGLSEYDVLLSNLKETAKKYIEENLDKPLVHWKAKGQSPKNPDGTRATPGIHINLKYDNPKFGDAKVFVNMNNRGELFFNIKTGITGKDSKGEAKEIESSADVQMYYNPVTKELMHVPILYNPKGERGKKRSILTGKYAGQPIWQAKQTLIDKLFAKSSKENPPTLRDYYTAMFEEEGGIATKENGYKGETYTTSNLEKQIKAKKAVQQKETEAGTETKKTGNIWSSGGILDDAKSSPSTYDPSVEGVLKHLTKDVEGVTEADTITVSSFRKAISIKPIEKNGVMSYSHNFDELVMTSVPKVNIYLNLGVESQAAINAVQAYRSSHKTKTAAVPAPAKTIATADLSTEFVVPSIEIDNSSVKMRQGSERLNQVLTTFFEHLKSKGTENILPALIDAKLVIKNSDNTYGISDEYVDSVREFFTTTTDKLLASFQASPTKFTEKPEQVTFDETDPGAVKTKEHLNKIINFFIAENTAKIEEETEVKAAAQAAGTTKETIPAKAEKKEVKKEAPKPSVEPVEVNPVDEAIAKLSSFDTSGLALIVEQGTPGQLFAANKKFDTDLREKKTYFMAGDGETLVPDEAMKLVEELRAKLDKIERDKGEDPLLKKDSDIPFSLMQEKEFADALLQNIETAVSNLSDILPDSITVKELSKDLEQAASTGKVWGAVKNRLLYLAAEHPLGTEYHEAFHVVFRTFLTDKEITSTLSEARSRYKKPTKNQLAKFKADRNYTGTDAEVLDMYYEEELAEEFQKYALGFKKDKPSWLRRIFDKLLRLLGLYTGKNSMNPSLTTSIDGLFSSIMNGKYKYASPVKNTYTGNNSTLYSLWRIGTYEGTRIKKNLDSQASTVLENTIAFKFFKKYNQNRIGNNRGDLIKYRNVVNEMYADYKKMLADFDTTTFKDKYKGISTRKSRNKIVEIMHGLKGIIGDLIVDDVIISEDIDMDVLKTINKKLGAYYSVSLNEDMFKSEEYKEEEVDANDTEDTQGNIGVVKQNVTQVGGFDSASKRVKMYLNTVVGTTNILGLNPRHWKAFVDSYKESRQDLQLAADGAILYSKLTKVLAHVPMKKMLKQLSTMSETSDDIRAFTKTFFDDILNELTALGYEFGRKDILDIPNSILERSQVYTSIASGLRNDKISQYDLLIDVREGLAQMLNANNRSAAKTLFNNWEFNWNLMYDKNNPAPILEANKRVQAFFDKTLFFPQLSRVYLGIDLDVKVESTDSTVGEMYGKTFEEFVNKTQDHFELIGINLPYTYVKYSLLQYLKKLDKPNVPKKDEVSIDGETIGIVEGIARVMQNNKDDVWLSSFSSLSIEHIDEELIDTLIFSTINAAQEKEVYSPYTEKDNEGNQLDSLGARGRLKDLADSISLFDDSILPAVFQNQKGQNIYEIVKPSYISETVAIFQDEDNRFILGEMLNKRVPVADVAKRAFENKIFDGMFPTLEDAMNYFETLMYNPLLNKFKDSLDQLFNIDFQVHYIGGMRQTDMEARANNIVEKGYGAQSNNTGVGYTDADRGAKLAALMYAFDTSTSVGKKNVSGNKTERVLRKEDGSKEVVEFVHIKPGIPSDASTTPIIKLPKMDAIHANGEISDEALKALRDLLKQEINRISIVQNEIRDIIDGNRKQRIVENYHFTLASINAEKALALGYSDFTINEDSSLEETADRVPIFLHEGKIYTLDRKNSLEAVELELEDINIKGEPVTVDELRPRGLQLFEFASLQEEAAGTKEDYEAIMNGKNLDDKRLDNMLSKWMNVQIDEFMNRISDPDYNLARRQHGKLINNKLSSYYYKTSTVKVADEATGETKDRTVKELDRVAISEFFINDYISSKSFNMLMFGDPAYTVKDAVDWSKRLKGEIASGPTYGTGKTRFYVVKSVERPLADSHDPVLNKKMKADYTDAQVHSTVNWHVNTILRSTGNLVVGKYRATGEPMRATDLYERIEMGIDDLTEEEAKFLYDNQAEVQPRKTVGFSMFNYVKTSVSPIFRSHVSYLENATDIAEAKSLWNIIFSLRHAVEDYADGNTPRVEAAYERLHQLYKPIKGREFLHNQLNNLERTNSGFFAYDSAIKRSKSDVATLTADGTDVYNYLDENKKNVISTQFISNTSLRDQLKTDGFKLDLIDGTQKIALIFSEQGDIDLPLFGKNKKYSPEQIVKFYENLLTARNEIGYSRVLKMLFKGTYDKDTEEFKGNVKDYRLLMSYLRDAAEASSTDYQFLELLSFDEENGVPKYSINDPSIEGKVQAMFISYIHANVLKHKAKGTKYSLVSSHGYQLMREVDEDGKVLRTLSTRDYKASPKSFNNSKVYKPMRLRYGVLDEKTGLYYTEAVVSERFALKHGFKIGDTIPEELLMMHGVRIPTQDKHSMSTLRIVDFTPAVGGNMIMTAPELIPLSGEDFDIDSRYVRMKDYFRVKNEGEADTIHLFGDYLKAKNITKATKLAYEEFLKEMSEDSKVKDAFSKYKKANQQVGGRFALAYAIHQSENLRFIATPTKFEEYDTALFKAFKKKYGEDIKTNFSIYQEDTALENYSPITRGETNNMLLDIDMTLTKNEGNHSISTTPATMTVFEDLNKVTDKLLTKKEITWGINSPLDKMNTDTAVATGNDNIGPAANANTLHQQLVKNNISLSDLAKEVDEGVEESVFKGLFDRTGSEGYTKFGTHSMHKGESKRINDLLSSILSAMTDNAKERHAAKYNLSLSSMGAALTMVQLGVPFNVAMLTMKQSVTESYLDEQAKFKNTLESEFDATNKKKIDRNKILRHVMAKEELTGKELFDEEITEDILLASLKFKEEYDAAKYKTFLGETMYTGATGKEYVEPEIPEYMHTTSDGKYYMSTEEKGSIMSKDIYDSIQAKILNEVVKATKYGEYLGNISAVLSLSKGLKPTFADNYILQDKLRELGYLGLKLEKDDKGFVQNVRLVYDEDFKASKQIFPIDRLMENTFIKSNLRNYAGLMDVSKEFFILENNEPRALMSKVVGSTRSYVWSSKGAFSKLRKHMLTHYVSLAIKNNVEEYKALDFNIFMETTDPEVKNNDMQKLFQKVMKQEGMQNNKLLRFLTLNRVDFTSGNHLFNGQTMFTIEGNTRSMKDPGFLQELTDAFTELRYAGEDGVELSRQLMHYLFVKDGFLYGNASFIKHIEPELLQNVTHRAQDKILELMNKTSKMYQEGTYNDKKVDEMYMELFGKTKAEVEYEFIEQYNRQSDNVINLVTTDVANVLRIAKENRKEIKAEIEEEKDDSENFMVGEAREEMKKALVEVVSPYLTKAEADFGDMPIFADNVNGIIKVNMWAGMEGKDPKSVWWYNKRTVQSTGFMTVGTNFTIREDKDDEVVTSFGLNIPTHFVSAYKPQGEKRMKRDVYKLNSYVIKHDDNVYITVDTKGEILSIKGPEEKLAKFGKTFKTGKGNKRAGVVLKTNNIFDTVARDAYLNSIDTKGNRITNVAIYRKSFTVGTKNFLSYPSGLKAFEAYEQFTKTGARIAKSANKNRQAIDDPEGYKASLEALKYTKTTKNGFSGARTLVDKAGNTFESLAQYVAHYTGFAGMTKEEILGANPVQLTSRLLYQDPNKFIGKDYLTTAIIEAAIDNEDFKQEIKQGDIVTNEPNAAIKSILKDVKNVIDQGYADDVSGIKEANPRLKENLALKLNINKITKKDCK